MTARAGGHGQQNTLVAYTRPDLGAWILVIVLSVFAVAPLAYPGFFQAQSGPLPAIKATHLVDTPVWLGSTASLLGEGRLPYLLAWPIAKISDSGFLAVRCGYAASFLLAAISAYAWTRRWLGKRGGVLAAAVYTYLPWHIGTVYARGAYAEAWLWVFWPVFLWSIDLVADRRESRSVELAASVLVGMLSLAAMFATHPGLAGLSMPFLAGYVAVRLTSRHSLVWGVATVALVMALVAGLCLFTVGSDEPRQYEPSDFLYPYQLLTAGGRSTQTLPQGKLDASGWTQADPVSHHLGLAAVGLSVVATALFAGRESSGSTLNEGDPEGRSPLPGQVFWYWLTVAVAIVVASLRPSAVLWSVTGLGRMAGHPWQLLAVTGLPLAFMAGSTIRQDERLGRLPAWAGLVGLVVLASYPYLAPRFIPTATGDPEPVALFQSESSSSPQIMILAAEVIPPSRSASDPQLLSLALTWQSLAEVEQDYTVFVHLLAPGSGDTKMAQRDLRPCSGECPTNAWKPGDIIVTHYEFVVPADAPPGRYRLAVGLYAVESGERATVVGREDDAVYLDVR